MITLHVCLLKLWDLYSYGITIYKMLNLSHTKNTGELPINKTLVNAIVSTIKYICRTNVIRIAEVSSVYD